MKNLLEFLLCIVFLFSPVFSAQFPEIFNNLNLDYPGLEKVRKALQKDDIERAQNELLLYFQNRTNVKASPRSFPANQFEADENARNQFEIKSIRQTFEEDINWKLIQIDKEWQFSLNRMKWFQNYVGVYENSYDERYVRAWMKQIESWIKIGDPGFPRTIDTGNRLENWVISYYMFVNKLKSPSVTAEFNLRVLQSMYDQVEYLFNPDHWRRYSNWGTFENTGFAKFVIFFPEFKRHQEWLKEIFFRMRFQLENSFYPDGMHIEVSPSYHSHELEVWFDFLDLAEINGYQNPWRPQIPMTPLREIILKRAEALMYWYKPNGRMPQVGDTDDRDERQLLLIVGEKWNRPDLLYVATDGVKGEVPAKTTRGFPEGGYYMLRSGWGKGDETSFREQLYLLFDTGRNEPWHAHFDMLNIIISAYGYDLLVDPGRYTYNDGPERDYFKSTQAHNTVVIDGRDQARDLSPQVTEFLSFSNFDYVAGNYKDSCGVIHKRSVFFKKPFYWIVTDRISGESGHQIGQTWHLSEMAAEKIGMDQDGSIIFTPHLVIASPPGEKRPSIKTGYISREYRVRKEAPVIQFDLGKSAPLVRSTVLYPYKFEQPQLTFDKIDVRVGESAIDSRSGAYAFILNNNGISDIYFEQEESGKICTFGGFETDALMAVINLDKRGDVAGYQLVRATYLKLHNETIANFYRTPVSVSMTDEIIEIKSECNLRFNLKTESDPVVLLNSVQIDPVRKKNMISHQR